MGASYTSARVNHLDMKRIYDAVIDGDVAEATKEKYFRRKPLLSELADIEVGDRGQSALILKNGDWVILDKTIDDDRIKEFRVQR